METLKSIFMFIKTNLALVLGVIIGILFFILGIERKKVDSLNAQKALNDTSNKDKAIEAQQQADCQQLAKDQNTLDKTNQSMVQLESDEAKKEQEEKSKNEEQIVDYWKNQGK